MNTPLLSIVIPSRNNTPEVINIFNELKRQSFQDFNFIVVDDNSDDCSQYNTIMDDNFFLYEYPGKWKFGLCKKYNYGFKQAIAKESKYIYILQSDMKINSTSLLEELVSYMEENETCGAVGPIVINGTGEVCWGHGIKKIRMGHEFNISESFLMRTECLTKHGLWDETFIYYGEEMDFFIRLRKDGYTSHGLKNVSVTHFGGGTTNRSPNQKDYHRPRYAILMMKLHNSEDSLYKKVRFFYSELSEQRAKIVHAAKNFQLFEVLRILYLIIAGTFVGLVTSKEAS
jgi:GT2 family glycosyltransferase